MQNVKHCVFCNHKFESRSARKRHNKSCEKNVNREKNQKISAANQRRRQDRLGGDRITGMDPALFSDIFSDLPDGAFFAVAEEHGLSPEDFI